ncbi:MAG: O-antigen ligase family protein, partial [Candidatus Hodarchaeota archaeon]
DTGEHRLYLWGCAWRMFLDNPLVGTGQGNGPWTISKYEPREGWYGRSEASRVFHSLYFTIIAELGVIGAFLFMGMLFPSFRDTKRILKLGEKYSNNQGENQTGNGFLHFKESKCIVLSIRGALITYLVSGGFLSVLYYPHFWLLLGLSVALKNMFPQLAVNNAKGISYGERPKMVEGPSLRKGPLAKHS